MKANYDFSEAKKNPYLSRVGRTWEEARQEFFTPEENAASDPRVARIGELVKDRKES